MIAEKNTNLLRIALPALLLFACQLATAQSTPDDTQSAEEKYTQVITTRSEKILVPLHITDSAVYHSVKAVVIQQYRDVNSIHDKKKEDITAVKNSPSADKTAQDAAIKKIEDITASSLTALHTKYIAKLSALLSPQQVEQIKDGMTYGVLPLTYNGYLDMLPALTDDQKKQVLVYLTEAREQAMDAESSDKKHQVFGKFKGRINNYLSAAGYDLKKEGEAWQKRIQERAATKK